MGSTGSAETLDRRSVGEALNRLAFAADILDEDVVDAKTASSLAWTIRSLEGDLTVDRLATLDGMSVPLLAVIDDVAHDRMPPLLAKLEARVPPGLLEVRRLKGLGPKKIRALWQELDITSVGELEYACRENRLVTLKGFGKKTQESVLEQIRMLREQAGLLRLDHAEALAELLVAALDAGAGAAAGMTLVAGDLRRRTEVVAEVALVTTQAPATVLASLTALIAKLGGANAVAAEDAADAAANAASAAHAGAPRLDGNYVRARLRGSPLLVRAGVPPGKLGTALVIETGTAAHVELLRERAQQKGFALDELEAADEAGVYDALGLLFEDPERREPGVPLVLKGKAKPKLVTLEDLRGSLHNHTTASDGDASMREMRDAAAERGLSYLAVTDHSQSAVYARGLASSQLHGQKAEAAALNDEKSSCTLLCGVESDILKDGELDYPVDVLKTLDVVVASVHSRFGQKGADLTARMVAAAKNPLSDIVGHPTGRLLLGRAPSEYDVSALLEVCSMSGAAVELNANPARLDLNERHLAEAKARGLLVSIAADAHATDELDNLVYGVSIARRAGLTVDDVLNARPLDAVRAWLKARRERARG